MHMHSLNFMTIFTPIFFLFWKLLAFPSSMLSLSWYSGILVFFFSRKFLVSWYSSLIPIFRKSVEVSTVYLLNIHFTVIGKCCPHRNACICLNVLCKEPPVFSLIFIFRWVVYRVLKTPKVLRTLNLNIFLRKVTINECWCDNVVWWWCWCSLQKLLVFSLIFISR